VTWPVLLVALWVGILLFWHSLARAEAVVRRSRQRRR